MKTPRYLITVDQGTDWPEAVFMVEQRTWLRRPIMHVQWNRG